MNALAVWLLLMAAALAPETLSYEESGFVTLDNGQGLRATISPAHGGELFNSVCIGVASKLRIHDGERLTMSNLGTVATDGHADAMRQGHAGIGNA